MNTTEQKYSQTGWQCLNESLICLSDFQTGAGFSLHFLHKKWQNLASRSLAYYLKRVKKELYFHYMLLFIKPFKNIHHGKQFKIHPILRKYCCKASAHSPLNRLVSCNKKTYCMKLKKYSNYETIDKQLVQSVLETF